VERASSITTIAPVERSIAARLADDSIAAISAVALRTEARSRNALRRGTAIVNSIPMIASAIASSISVCPASVPRPAGDAHSARDARRAPCSCLPLG
jgi:hypothetical protein